jgi:hypothetical protein
MRMKTFCGRGVVHVVGLLAVADAVDARLRRRRHRGVRIPGHGVVGEPDPGSRAASAVGQVDSRNEPGEAAGHTSGSASTMPRMGCLKVCRRTGLTTVPGFALGTYHSSFCSTVVTSTESSARTTRLSRK